KTCCSSSSRLVSLIGSISRPINSFIGLIMWFFKGEVIKFLIGFVTIFLINDSDCSKEPSLISSIRVWRVKLDDRKILLSVSISANDVGINLSVSVLNELVESV